MDDTEREKNIQIVCQAIIDSAVGNYSYEINLDCVFVVRLV